MGSPCRDFETASASVLLEDSTLDELSAFSDEEDFADEELDFSELLDEAGVDEELDFSELLEL